MTSSPLIILEVSKGNLGSLRRPNLALELKTVPFTRQISSNANAGVVLCSAVSPHPNAGERCNKVKRYVLDPEKSIAVTDRGHPDIDS